MIVCFAIGNSDDKLGQSDWSSFVAEVHLLVDQAVQAGARIQFSGYAPPAAPWQNALWAVEFGDGLPQSVRFDLRNGLRAAAGRWRQDSIAWWQAGTAEMLTPTFTRADR